MDTRSSFEHKGSRGVSSRDLTVAVTGAFGNLGRRVLQELSSRGHRVIALDLDNKANRAASEKVKGAFDEAHWGDIRAVNWAEVLQDVQAVIHLAAVLPPVTEKAPELAEAVNLTSTLKLIDALGAQPQPAQLIFPSSLTVFGYPTSQALKTVDDAPKPSDNYTRHKVTVEQRLATSSIPWSVLRIGVSVDGEIPATDQSMTRRLFATHPGNPVEYVHPADVALAAVNAVGNPEAMGKIWLIGGGASCRVTQYDLLSAPLGAMGVTLPRDFLGTEQYYTHWMDTAESERVLRFQRHSFDDFRRELRGTIGRWRPLTRPFALLILWGLRRSLKAK